MLSYQEVQVKGLPKGHLACSLGLPMGHFVSAWTGQLIQLKLVESVKYTSKAYTLSFYSKNYGRNKYLNTVIQHTHMLILMLLKGQSLKNLNAGI